MSATATENKPSMGSHNPTSVRGEIAEAIARVVNDRVIHMDSDFIAHLTHVPDKKFENACIPLDYLATLDQIQKRLNPSMQVSERSRLLSNILSKYPQPGLRVVKGEDTDHPLLSLPYAFQGRNALKIEEVPKEFRETEIREALAAYGPASQPVISETPFPGRWLATFESVADAEALLSAINLKPLTMRGKTVRVMLRPQCFNPITVKPDDHISPMAPSAPAATAAPAAAAAPEQASEGVVPAAAPAVVPEQASEGVVPAAAAAAAGPGLVDMSSKTTLLFDPFYGYRLYVEYGGKMIPVEEAQEHYMNSTRRAQGGNGGMARRGGNNGQYRGNNGGHRNNGGQRQQGMDQRQGGGMRAGGMRSGMQGGRGGGMQGGAGGDRKRGPKYGERGAGQGPQGGAGGRGGDKKRGGAGGDRKGRQAREGAGEPKEQKKPEQRKPDQSDFPELAD